MRWGRQMCDIRAWPWSLKIVASIKELLHVVTASRRRYVNGTWKITRFFSQRKGDPEAILCKKTRPPVSIIVYYRLSSLWRKQLFDRYEPPRQHSTIASQLQFWIINSFFLSAVQNKKNRWNQQASQNYVSTFLTHLSYLITSYLWHLFVCVPTANNECVESLR